MRTLAKRVAALLLVTAMLAGSAPWVLADTDLQIGGLAIVANTGGDSVFVRAGAGYDYLVLTTADPGDTMTVLDGPFEGEDGGLWYEVSYGGTVGYTFADFLVLPENAPLHPQRNGNGSHRTTASGYISTIGGTGGDGARMRRCPSAPSSDHCLDIRAHHRLNAIDLGKAPKIVQCGASLF